MPAKSPPVSILFMEFSEEISMNRSTKSGDTWIGRSPRSRQPVVRFLTFLVIDQRSGSDEDVLRADEVFLSEAFLAFLEDNGISIAGFDILMVSWYIATLLISLGLNLFGLGRVELTPARGTPVEVDGRVIVAALFDADLSGDLEDAVGDLEEGSGDCEDGVEDALILSGVSKEASL